MEGGDTAAIRSKGNTNERNTRKELAVKYDAGEVIEVVVHVREIQESVAVKHDAEKVSQVVIQVNEIQEKKTRGKRWRCESCLKW